MRSTPGALIVDKTSFAPPMKLHSSRRNVVIRRPPGFGKTALLSMLEAYVNLEDEIDDDFFSTVDLKSIEIPTSLRDVDGRRGLLVISLDLSKLILSDGDSEEAILDHCNAFMDRELCRTAARYHGLLHPLYGPNLDEIDSAWAFMVRCAHIFGAAMTDSLPEPAAKAAHLRHDHGGQLHRAFRRAICRTQCAH